ARRQRLAESETPASVDVEALDERIDDLMNQQRNLESRRAAGKLADWLCDEQLAPLEAQRVDLVRKRDAARRRQTLSRATVERIRQESSAGSTFEDEEWFALAPARRNDFL